MALSSIFPQPLFVGWIFINADGVPKKKFLIIFGD